MKNTTLVAVIGMIALLATSLVKAQVPPSSGDSGGSSGSITETIPGCSCQTSGFSTITGQSCAGNVCTKVSIPDRLPIGDADDLQAYAWEKVTQIGISGWASSAINSSTNVHSTFWIQYPQTNGVVDVEEVFGIIKAQQLTLSVLYPSDTINLQTFLYDTNYNNLFYSSASSGINPPTNGVSKNKLDVLFNMNPDIWIPFSGAQWFEIVERDEKGNPIRYYSSGQYDIQNGMIRFPAYFAKKGGEVIVTLFDGTQVAFALNGGARIIPTTVQIIVGNVSSVGTRTFRDTNVAYVEVSSDEFKQNINPLSQLVISKYRPIALAAWYNDPNTGLNVYAGGVSIWLQGQPSSTAQNVPIPSSGHYAMPYLQAGRYWMKYSFPGGWPGNQNQFYPPYQDNSGATSVTTTTTEK